MDLLEINHQSTVPLHAQVEKLLRKMIGMPEYQSGKLLPNEIHIAKKLGVSRNTVRQATNKLVYEQLLIRKKGVGTTVARNNITTRLEKWDSFTHEMDEKGMAFRNYSVKISLLVPDEEIRQLFRTGPETSVLKMERVKGLDGDPIVYFVSWFHPRTGLTIDDDFSKPLYEMLEKDHHVVASVSREGISAKLADKMLGKLLSVEPGAAILFRKRVVCDAGDRPIEYNLGYYRADRFTYTIDIARK